MDELIPDDELAKEAMGGNTRAFAELHARYVRVIWRYASGQLRPHEAAAADAVSETFLAALKGGYDPNRGSVAQWLMGIARHKIADERQPTRMLRFAVETASPEMGDALVASETQAAVAQLMAQLADEERLVLEWKYLDGVPVREIAARLGRTEKAAEALLFRARQAFRERSKYVLETESTS